jgi:uncharacterized protein YoxC
MSLLEIFAVIAVGLLAVLVGVAIPAVLQLRSTLKSAETFLEETRPKLKSVLDQAGEAAGRVNRAAAEIEDGVGRLRGVIDTVGALGDSLERARVSLRKATAVLSSIGPALAAGFRSFFLASDETPPAPEAPATAKPASSSGPGQASEEA